MLVNPRSIGHGTTNRLSHSVGVLTIGQSTRTPRKGITLRDLRRTRTTPAPVLESSLQKKKKNHRAASGTTQEAPSLPAGTAPSTTRGDRHAGLQSVQSAANACLPGLGARPRAGVGLLPRPSPHSVNPVTAPLSPRRLRRSVPPSPEMTDRLSGTRQSSTRLTRPAVATKLLAAVPWVRSGAPCCPCGGRPAKRRSLASEERPPAARASRRQGTPPQKKRTTAQPAGRHRRPLRFPRALLHPQRGATGTPVCSRYSQLRMPACPGSAPDPGQGSGCCHAPHRTRSTR